ncbi:hypothetical protein ILYODFUR_029290 [Ilyodon furcidens]|uniref:Uncharacterized protein n=1 Tax=Ilyodon furcidens TaxID=33524 RepID=A0ABV0T181_9TELE
MFLTRISQASTTGPVRPALVSLKTNIKRCTSIKQFYETYRCQLSTAGRSVCMRPHICSEEQKKKKKYTQLNSEAGIVIIAPKVIEILHLLLGEVFSAGQCVVRVQSVARVQQSEIFKEEAVSEPGGLALNAPQLPA